MSKDVRIRVGRRQVEALSGTGMMQGQFENAHDEEINQLIHAGPVTLNAETARYLADVLLEQCAAWRYDADDDTRADIRALDRLRAAILRALTESEATK